VAEAHHGDYEAGGDVLQASALVGWTRPGIGLASMDPWVKQE